MNNFEICVECTHCNEFQTKNEVPTCYNVDLLKRFGFDVVTGVQKFHKKPCDEVRKGKPTCSGFERAYISRSYDMYE